MIPADFIPSQRALWPDEVTVGEIVYPVGGKFGSRRQTYLQFVWLYTGEMTVWIDGVAHFATAQTVTILFPGHEELFRFSTTEETHHSWIHISVSEVPTGLRERLERIPRTLPYSPVMADLIFSALTLRFSTLTTRDELLKTLAMQMVWRFLGEGEQLLANAERDMLPAVQRIVEQTCQYMQLHLHETLTLDQIAAAVSVSASHLIRLFRAQLRITPIAYLWNQRAAAAVELLRYSGLSLQSIADRCGFQNVHHLSRRVKQSTGLTPTQIRHRSWGSDAANVPD